MKVGKPRKYETREELIAVIEKYFNDTDPKEYTVTGLALAVGSKQLLNDYQRRDEFEDIVTQAKLIVENEYEKSLRKNGRTGDIFALKNFGWTDKIEQVESIDVDKLDENQLDSLINKILDKDQEK